MTFNCKQSVGDGVAYAAPVSSYKERPGFRNAANKCTRCQLSAGYISQSLVTPRPMNGSTSVIIKVTTLFI